MIKKEYPELSISIPVYIKKGNHLIKRFEEPLNNVYSRAQQQLKSALHIKLREWPLCPECSQPLSNLDMVSHTVGENIVCYPMLTCWCKPKEKDMKKNPEMCVNCQEYQAVEGDVLCSACKLEEEEFYDEKGNDCEAEELDTDPDSEDNYPDEEPEEDELPF